MSQWEQENFVSVGGMHLSSAEVIPELEADKDYQYLQATNIMHPEMKDKIQKEYYRRVWQLRSSKLSDGIQLGQSNHGLYP